MGRKPKNPEEMVYCICPKCGTKRERIEGSFNIIRRGYERNGLARFYCLGCKTWFNEKSGKAMDWYSRT